MNARRFWAWVVITPFGRPVVPEVNKMSDTASPRTAAIAARAASAGIRRARATWSAHEVVLPVTGPSSNTISRTGVGSPEAASSSG